MGKGTAFPHKLMKTPETGFFLCAVYDTMTERWWTWTHFP